MSVLAVFPTSPSVSVDESRMYLNRSLQLSPFLFRTPPNDVDRLSRSALEMSLSVSNVFIVSRYFLSCSIASWIASAVETASHCQMEYDDSDWFENLDETEEESVMTEGVD